MSKKHIALLLPSMANGGAERVMLNIARGLAKQDDLTIDIVLCKAEGPYLQQVPESIRVIDLECSRIIYSLGPMIRYLKEEQPAALLSALDTTNLIAIWATKFSRINAKVIVTVHCNFSGALKGQTNARSKFLPLLVRIFYRFSDKILAVSKGVAEDLAKTTGIDSDQITVQVNPVITPELVDKAKLPCKHPWFIESKPVILGIGRLTYQKNFELLINAFATVKQRLDARLIILGEGEELESLQHLAKKLAIELDVDFPGFVDNPYPFMREASLFVLSSRYEGLPTVLIEALQCGAPVVSTDCPSGPLEILENGNLGYLVPVNDIDELANAMINVLSTKDNSDKKSQLDQYCLHNVIRAYKEHLINP